MIHTVYCTERPFRTHPRLIPIVKVWLNDWGMPPQVAARQAFERHGPTDGPWALMDQPPNWNGHTYKSNFGDHTIYDWDGPGEGARRLRDWMTKVFRSLKHEYGYRTPPEFMPIDWEGHYVPIEFDRSKFSETVSLYTRLALLRAEAINYCVVGPARQVWEWQIEATNYEDRPLIVGDNDNNDWPFPPVGVGAAASPTAYTRLDRAAPGTKADHEAFRAAYGLGVTVARAKAAGVEVVPWMASTGYVGDGLAYDYSEPGRVIFDIAQAVGVERCILWGPKQQATQRWLVENA